MEKWAVRDRPKARERHACADSGLTFGEGPLAALRAPDSSL